MTPKLLESEIFAAVLPWQRQGARRLSHWWTVSVGHGEFDAGACTYKTCNPCDMPSNLRVKFQMTGNFQKGGVAIYPKFEV